MSNQNMSERRKFKLLISKVKSLITTMDKIIEHSSNIGFNYISCNTFAKMYNDLVIESTELITDNTKCYVNNLDKLKNPYNMTSVQQKEVFEYVYCSARMLLNILETHFDYTEDETNNLQNLITTRFRSVFRTPPKDENEVQDKLEDFFIANNYDKGLDYDRETGKFNFSGREYIPDFIIPKLKLCI